jgi:FtsH-binding integral membrane protein
MLMVAVIGVGIAVPVLLFVRSQVRRTAIFPHGQG